MRKILMTGGAGFVGSQMAAKLFAAGEDIIVYDNLSLGRKEFVKSLIGKDRFKFVEADLLDFEALGEAMKGRDLVIHLAANSDISQGPARNDLDFETGTIGTYNVLENMRKYDVKEIVFSSTSAIYGEAHLKPTPESYGPLFPISFYGASKLASETLITAFAHNCGFRAWIYRFANVVGRNATHGVILDFVRRLFDNPAELKILGDGSQRKCYIHADDCIDGMLFGVKNGKGHKLRPEIDCFNLAGDGVTQVRFIAEETIRLMEPLTGKKATLILGEGDRGWRGDVPYTYLDASALRDLGWKPKYTSDQAMTKAVGEIIEQVRRTR